MSRPPAHPPGWFNRDHDDEHQYVYRVSIVLSNGKVVEFLSDRSFDTTGDFVYWHGVLVDGKELEYYSLPSTKVEEIREEEIQ